MKTTFTKLFAGRWQMFVCFFFLVSVAAGQAVPELMYYKFDAAGNQTNYASTPAGTNPAILNGLTIGSTGQFGTALVGNGSTSTSNYLNTGWATNMPSTGWTISFWVDNFAATSSTTYYYFGDNTAASFRCFTGGVAGNGNLWLRGTGFTDVHIDGIPTTPTVIHLVYTGSEVRVFFNGVYSSSTAQGAVTFSGTGPFKVGGYSSSNSINAGTLMDEFRMYNRPLTDLEVGQTWNQSLPLGGPPIVVTSAATAVTSTTATINGTVNANNASTTVTFEYGLTAAYGTVLPGVPGTVTGSTVTPVSANLSSLIPGTTYHYRVSGINSFGTANGGDMTFTTAPVLPVVTTTTATSVTSTTASLNGTVNAGGASTTVTFEYGLTVAYGTTVAGTPSPVTGNTVTDVSANITGLTVNNTYHYRVKGVNSIGTANGNDMTFFTSNCPMPGPPGPITGSATVCGNSTGNVYMVSPITNVIDYHWTLPAGAVITAGSNTNSITVTFGSASGNVSVYGSNTCGNGSTSTLPVTVYAAPVPTITGQTTLCVNSGNYEYTTESGQNNYTWTVSTGGTIISGAGTNQIEVTWNTAGAQAVTVNYTNVNGCSAPTPTSYAVTVNPLPGAAGTITGTSAVCDGTQGVAYSIAPVTNATIYVWDLPAGATIATGANTNSITVDFAANASSGDITVNGNNLCGNGPASPPFAITINPLPDAAGTITGLASVCAGDNWIGYTVSTIANATSYTWTVPAGVTIVSGSGTNTIIVDFSASAVSGIISVAGTNSCGNGTSSPDFNVTVNPIPPTPVITQNGIILTSSSLAGNQWYLNGGAITGATGQTYEVDASGIYYVIVTLDGCSSNPSNTINIVMPGIDQLSGTNLSLSPVPNNGVFTVSITSPNEDKFTISIYNNLGIKIFDTNMPVIKGTVNKLIDIRPAPVGIYVIVFKNSSGQEIRKILVNK